jgi:hypothetical protein
VEHFGGWLCLCFCGQVPSFQERTPSGAPVVDPL